MSLEDRNSDSYKIIGFVFPLEHLKHKSSILCFLHELSHPLALESLESTLSIGNESPRLMLLQQNENYEWIVQSLVASLMLQQQILFSLVIAVVVDDIVCGLHKDLPPIKI